MCSAKAVPDVADRQPKPAVMHCWVIHTPPDFCDVCSARSATRLVVAMRGLAAALSDLFASRSPQGAPRRESFDDMAWGLSDIAETHTWSECSMKQRAFEGWASARTAPGVRAAELSGLNTLWPMTPASAPLAPYQTASCVMLQTR